MRRGDNEDALQRRFWRKIARAGASIPFAEDQLTAYYCGFDHDTPLTAKATLVAALAYFVPPVDAIPDALPVIGFTDDAAVLETALKLRRATSACCVGGGAPQAGGVHRLSRSCGAQATTTVTALRSPCP